MNRLMACVTLLRGACATLLLGACATLLLGACAPGVCQTIRQPLVTGSVEHNQAVEQHRFAERTNRLPKGAMADAATLTRVGDDICFDVIMHEVDAIDLARAHAVLIAQGQRPLDNAQLQKGETHESAVGTVPLYESRGQMCFANHAYVTTSTKGFELDVTVARPDKSDEDKFIGQDTLDGTAQKRTRFLWHFAGAQKKP